MAIKTYHSQAALLHDPPAAGTVYLLEVRELVGDLELFWRVVIAGQGTVAFCFEEATAQLCAEAVESHLRQAMKAGKMQVEDIFYVLLRNRGIKKE